MPVEAPHSSFIQRAAAGPIRRLLVSIAALAGAVLLRWALDPILEDTLPLVTLFGAVAIAVWLNGYAVALLHAAVGYVACAYLFIEPRGELGLGIAANLAGLMAYLFTVTIIVVLGERVRRAERTARLRAEWFRTTLSSIGDAVISTDRNGRIAMLNPVAQELTGYQGDAAVGRPLQEGSRSSMRPPASRWRTLWRRC